MVYSVAMDGIDEKEAIKQLITNFIHSLQITLSAVEKQPTIMTLETLQHFAFSLQWNCQKKIKTIEEYNTFHDNVAEICKQQNIDMEKYKKEYASHF